MRPDPIASAAGGADETEAQVADDHESELEARAGDLREAIFRYSNPEEIERERALFRLAAMFRGRPLFSEQWIARQMTCDLRRKAGALMRVVGKIDDAHPDIGELVAAALRLAAEREADTDPVPPESASWTVTMPIPEFCHRGADACRAVLLDLVEPEGAILHDGRRSDELGLIIGLAFSRSDLLPADCTSWRLAWRRLGIEERRVVDAAARSAWPPGSEHLFTKARDDAPYDTGSGGGDSAALSEDSAEAAACRSVIEHNILIHHPCHKENAFTKVVLQLAFGEGFNQIYCFRNAWRFLDRRQRRLVDAAARAAWPCKNEPHIVDWW